MLDGIEIGEKSDCLAIPEQSLQCDKVYCSVDRDHCYCGMLFSGEDEGLLGLQQCLDE